MCQWQQLRTLKWFGNGQMVFIHSGHPSPSEEEPAVRNEGAGTVLSKREVVSKMLLVLMWLPFG